MTYDHYRSGDNNLKRMITKFLEEREILNHPECIQLCFLADFHSYKKFDNSISKCSYKKAKNSVLSEDFRSAVLDLAGDYVDSSFQLHDSRRVYEYEYIKTYPRGDNWLDEYDSTIEHILSKTEDFDKEELITEVEKLNIYEL